MSPKIECRKHGDRPCDCNVGCGPSHESAISKTEAAQQRDRRRSVQQRTRGRAKRAGTNYAAALPSVRQQHAVDDTFEIVPETPTMSAGHHQTEATGKDFNRSFTSPFADLDKSLKDLKRSFTSPFADFGKALKDLDRSFTSPFADFGKSLKGLNRSFTSPFVDFGKALKDLDRSFTSPFADFGKTLKDLDGDFNKVLKDLDQSFTSPGAKAVKDLDRSFTSPGAKVLKDLDRSFTSPGAKVLKDLDQSFASPLVDFDRSLKDLSPASMAPALLPASARLSEREMHHLPTTALAAIDRVSRRAEAAADTIDDLTRKLEATIAEIRKVLKVDSIDVPHDDREDN
jgi:hypothetical protein